MFRPFILTLILISTISCNYSQDTKPDTDVPLAIVLKLIRQYDTIYQKQDFYFGQENNGYEVPGDSVKQHIFNINVTIKNDSDKSIFIWLMSCSWPDNFLINNDYMFLVFEGCNKNIPQKIEIKAGQSRTYQSQLTKSIKFDYTPKGWVYGRQVETTKLGLIVINDIHKDEYVDYHTLIRDKSRWTIYWSNPLYLLTPEESNPKPITIPVYDHN